MDVKPVKKYDGPDYPAKWVLDQHPELLRLIPKRWRNNPAALASLGVMILLMAGCRNASVENQQSAIHVASTVAPIFLHGKGYGSFGCVAVNPPILLSEAEARKIIEEEGKRAGIIFKRDAVTLNQIDVPITNRYGFMDNLPDANGNKRTVKKKSTTARKSVTLDGYDLKRGIGYEYVSETDFTAWERINSGATAYSFDMLNAAKDLKKGIALSDRGGYYGVFYDPEVGIGDAARKMGSKSGPRDYDKISKIAASMAKDELRAQVRDFIKWLKIEGII